ncbi:MAG TPA: acyl-CoA dehydrogenase family protein [Burkholderiaceae bacterium]|nr:acyl-CoA dehydrogenase family protein [Burkholderiaceae bacterium]
MSAVEDSLIERSVQRLFADEVDKGVRDRVEAGQFDERLWRLAVDSGFTLALASESAGGIGESWSAVVPILHGLGCWQVPLPLAETMIGALLLSAAGIAIPDGPLTVLEQGQSNDLVVRGSDASLRVHGSAPHVAWARHAHALVLSLADGQLALLDLRERQGVSCEERSDHARMPSDTLRFDGALCVAVARCPLALTQPVWHLGALARSVMMVGALEAALEQSVRYAAERVQFGKPIGRNQALQQQLALMAGDAAAARMAALAAAGDAPSLAQRDASAAPFSIAVAKVRCGEAATRATGIAHQVHGAIGFTREHSLHYATRRLWAWREQFGNEAFWAERLGRAAVAVGPAGFWAALTQRRFEGSL